MNWVAKFSILIFTTVILNAGPNSALAQSANDLRQDTVAANKMAAQAKKYGVVRLIVTTKAPPSVRSMTPDNQDNLVNLVAKSQSQALQTAGAGSVDSNSVVKFKYTAAMALTATPDQFSRIMADPAFTGVYEDTLLFPSLADSVPLVGGPVAWESEGTGDGQVVAVLDTGVDSQHQFLKDKIVDEACFGTYMNHPLMRVRPACPNGKKMLVGPETGKPCVGISSCSHGTHVAGIVAGKGRKFSGVAPEAKIIAVQVFSLMKSPFCVFRTLKLKCVLAFSSDTIRALEWVYEQRRFYKIAAVNLSLGGGHFEEPCDDKRPAFSAMAHLLNRVGIAVVVASGNGAKSTGLSAPACVTEAISVGASTFDDEIAKFSNSASFLDLLAPGINSHTASVRGIQSAIPGGYFERNAGTSMAAPHVAGAFAALRSINPSASVEQILTVLKDTGKMITESRNNVVTPRIQVDNAVSSLEDNDGTKAQRISSRKVKKPVARAVVPTPRQPAQPTKKPMPKKGVESIGGIKIYDNR